MPHQCGCVTPCNCIMEEDGYWAERPQDGRRNTILSGSGTPNDPFTISFMQSEFFRPSAGELVPSSLPIVLASGSNDSITQSEVTVSYQTPGEIFINFALNPVILTALIGNFMLVGASAAFAASNTTGTRSIGIGTNHPFTAVTRFVTSSEQGGSSTRSSYVQASGFASGNLDKTGLLSGITDSKIAPFSLTIFQSSGGPIDVTQVKFWVAVI